MNAAGQQGIAPPPSTAAPPPSSEKKAGTWSFLFGNGGDEQMLRRQVKEYVGSAAFSKAVQCLDLHSGEMVCVKIIKNNKDFFDQSLDEIKLLRYLRK